MITCILVDDEPGAISSLEIMLSDFCPDVKILGTANNIEIATEVIKIHHPDLIFLDIQMPNGSGIDFMEKYNGDAQVIFTTAYSEHAIKAIKLAAFDYLLKPIDHRELIQSIERFNDFKKNGTPDTGILKELLTKKEFKKITLQTKEGFHFIELVKLLYCEAAKSYTLFHFEDGSYIVASKPIGEYESILPKQRFTRIHRSFIVNIDKIQKYQRGRGGVVTLTNNIELEVSRNFKDDLISKLNISNLNI